MNILITGGAGFVGSNVAKALAKDGHNVEIIDNLSFGYARNIGSEKFFLKQDFATLTEDDLEYYDVLIHCATVNINYAIRQPIETFKVNALDTINLFKKFKKKIIYTSTSSVYGQAETLPTKESAEENVFNAYDQSKLIAEKYLEQRGNYSTLRLSNVYGINQRPENHYAGVVAKFIYALLKGDNINIYGSGKATRDYTYIDDVVSAVKLLVDNQAVNRVYNISGGYEISTIDLMHKLSGLMAMPENYTFVEKRKIDKISRRLLDCTLIHTHLGWKPKTNFNDGLMKTIDWIRKEYGL